ncbi:15790_t:CDS:2, partial [Funneliformis geosporum]
IFLHSNEVINSALIAMEKLKKYYNQHKWEKKYIDDARKKFIDLYKNHYAPIENETSNLEEDFTDDLLLHIYKRRRVENKSETEQYLEAPLAPIKTNVLQWWK